MSTARFVLVATTPSSCSIPTSIPLRPGESLTFGRSVKDVDVYLDSTLVKNMISRSHAKVVYDAVSGRVSLFDLNSTNGVYVNDRKIQVQQLSHGDRVTFGGRGKSVAMGAVDMQPSSEFIYEFQQEGAQDEDEEPGMLELAKSLTDHAQLLATWIGTAGLLGSYLFAEEDSKEFSYASSYVAPVFALVGAPFNRVTFTVSFVLGVGLLLALAIYFLRAGSKGKKKSSSGAGGKGKKKA